MSGSDESLWDDEWIKQALEKIAREERPMRSFMDTTTSSSTNIWGEPREYMTQFVKEVKKVKDEEPPKKEPEFFDPKELDIDVDK